MTQIADRDRWLLGKLLAQFDKLVDSLDRAVFDAAYNSADHRGLDHQRDRALSDSFQHPSKTERNNVLEQRNCLARILRFPERCAHDFGPRGYIVEQGEFLRPV